MFLYNRVNSSWESRNPFVDIANARNISIIIQLPQITEKKIGSNALLQFLIRVAEF